MQSDSDFAAQQIARAGPARGLTAIGIFLFFGAAMACLAGATLVWPGTRVDKIWALNATAYVQLKPLGWRVGIPFLMLSVALTSAGVGWFQRRAWGWRLAVGVIAVQVLGDLVNLLRGDVVGGGTGFVIAAALLLYLLRREVRVTFATGPSERRASDISAG